MTDVEVPITTRKDWMSDQEIRWCPGCGRRLRIRCGVRARGCSGRIGAQVRRRIRRTHAVAVAGRRGEARVVERRS